MLNGAIAAIFFFVWAWIGVRIYNHIWPESYDFQSKPDNFWFQNWIRRKSSEFFAIFWSGTLLLYFILAKDMHEACGTVEDLLSPWMFFSAALAMVLLSAIFLIIVFLPLIAGAASCLMSAGDEATKGIHGFFSKTDPPSFVNLKKPLIFLTVILFFCFLVWSAAQPNPLCGADLKSTTEIKALPKELEPNIDAIRATLEEHNPELLDDLNTLLKKDKADDETQQKTSVQK